MMMIQRWNLHTLLIATLRLRSCASFHHTSLHRSSTSNTRTRTHTRTYTTRTFNPLKPIRITTFESNNDSVLVEKEKENEKNDLDNQYDNQYEYWKNQHSQKTISNILVCGDGDLSYSANIAQSLHEKNINLIATVLEEQNVHCEIYQHSTTNHQKIKSYKNNNNNKNNHEVKYGIDATKLEENFPNTTFDRIQFNFPHWRGKANHKYNRQLIDSFLKSASFVLAKNGEIHIALCEGQGGSNANNLQEYRDTWTPAFFASSHGLLLFDVLPFAVSYNLSSHRGVDRGFKIGKAPEMYIFGKPNQSRPSQKRREQMMCSRHELHVVLPDDEDDPPSLTSSSSSSSSSQYSIKDITEGNAIEEIVKSVVPEGIKVEIPERKILKKEDSGYELNMAIYLIVYGGESAVLTRDEADSYRHAVECEVEKHIPLRENRRGRLVSRPFPYHLLRSIIDDHMN